MIPDVVIACGMQRAYFHELGGRYFGDKIDILRIRLLDYLSSAMNPATTIFFIREVHQGADEFFKGSKTYGQVGSPDIEIPEVFKHFPKFIINTTRYSGFYKTPLESELAKLKPKRVSLVGVETHTNVLFTAVDLRNRGYAVTIPEPLVVSEDDYMHSCGINILSNVLSVDVE